MERPMNNVIPPASVRSLAPARESHLGRILLDMGKIKPEDTEHILHQQKEKDMRFGDIARSLGLVTEADIELALARQFRYDYLPPDQGRFAPELVAAYRPFSEQAETLRAVRSELMLRWFANGRKALAVASVDSGGGASLFAANLSVLFSHLGERTLLVDANMRAPAQHRIFDLQGRQGLSDILAGRGGAELITNVDPFADLSVLQAGTLPPNPQELLSRHGFADFAERTGHLYDIVLYDTPAFSACSDALAIAARVAGVLLVVRRNSTSVAAVRSVAAQLGRVGGEVVGSVMVD